MPNLKLEQFSKHRLNGEMVPHDVKALLAHSDELNGRVGVNLNWDEGWAPWLDTSYLSEADRANPDIAANVRAIHEVCGHIAFIAMEEDSQYFGYWRGINNLPVAECPIVFLDNEGQFRLCPSATFAHSVLAQKADSYFQKEGELRDWMRSIGVSLPDGNPNDLPSPDVPFPPDKLHQELYARYRG